MNLSVGIDPTQAWHEEQIQLCVVDRLDSKGLVHVKEKTINRRVEQDGAYVENLLFCVLDNHIFNLVISKEQTQNHDL